MEMHKNEKPEDMFNGYYNLRYFLSHKDNAYQLDIGKLLQCGFESKLRHMIFQLIPFFHFVLLFSKWNLCQGRTAIKPIRNRSWKIHVQ